MARETKLDEMVKEPMVNDTCQLVSPPEYDRVELVKVFERRLGEMQKSDRQMAMNSGTFKSRNSKKSGSGSGSGSSIPKRNALSEQEQLEQDLSKILMNKVPRQVGELPANMGGELAVNFIISTPQKSRLTNFNINALNSYSYSFGSRNSAQRIRCCVPTLSGTIEFSVTRRSSSSHHVI